MKALAISASTQCASLAIGKIGNEYVEICNHRSQSHSEFLNKGLQSLLSQTSSTLSEVDLIAVDIGPGSFTGVRAAVNLAKTLGYSLKKPVTTRTSLQLLNQGLPKNHVVAINAYKNLLFTSWDHESEVTLMSIAEFSQKVLSGSRARFAVGDGILTYWPLFSSEVQSKLIRSDSFFDFPKAKTFFSLEVHSTFDWKNIEPLYIRPSSAEEVLLEKTRSRT